MTTDTTASQTVTQALQETPYFSGLSPEEIAALAQISQSIRYEAGELIFSEGGEARSFFIVLAGQVQIYKLSAEGKEMILHLFGQGDIFAELPVFGHVKTYPAFAMCLKPTRVLAIAGEGFRELVSKRPEMLLNILMRFAQRLREFGALIEDLALRNVDSRLAKYLLSLSENTPQKAKIQIHKKTLAAILGTVPETLSRSFKKLSDQGIIELHEQTVDILNRTELQSMAEPED